VIFVLKYSFKILFFLFNEKTDSKLNKMYQ
jgi:hypothetical protein